MMGRLTHDQEQFFYSFRLDEAVPDDHPVREIAAVLDLSWVHSELAPYYPQLGRPSINRAKHPQARKVRRPTTAGHRGMLCIRSAEFGGGSGARQSARERIAG